MARFKIPAYLQWLLVSSALYLVIMTLLRIVFLFTFPAPAVSGKIPLAPVFWLGFRFDIRIISIVSLLSFVLYLIPPVHPFKSRTGKTIVLTIWILFAITLCLFYTFDFANYAYLSERLNAGLLNYAYDTKTSLGMLWQSYPVIKVSLMLICAISILFFLTKKLFSLFSAKSGQVSKASRVLSPVIFFLLSALAIFGRAGQYPLRWSDAFSLGNDYASNVALNPFQSFFSSLNFREAAFDPEKVKAAYPEMAAYLGGIPNADSGTISFTRHIDPGASSAPKPNVIIVICESFSSYKSSMHGNPLNTTPFFNQLCEQGIYFNKCFTPSYGTARGVWATITGTPDIGSETSSRNPNAVNQHSIINDFKGYEKFYFIGGSASWANIRGLLTNNIQGLHLYEQEDYKAPKIDVWGISDKNLLLEASDILAEQTRPFIAVIQTSDNHRPYTIPKEDREEFKLRKVSADSLKKFGFTSLDEFNAFRYTDFCFQKFIESARKKPYFNNTLFVFVGDHGIRGDAGDMFPRAWTEELSTVHVPLLFYAPHILPAEVIPAYASQLDVLPTAAGICKIPYINTTLGRDLLSAGIRNNPKAHQVFVYDPDARSAGVIKDSVYYSYLVERPQQTKIMNVNSNNPVVLTEEQKRQLHHLAESFYQTSGYLLLNNKAK